MPPSDSPFGTQDTSNGIKIPSIHNTNNNAEDAHNTVDLVDGWEHDPIKMEIKFACSHLNWKAHLPKLKDDVLKIYAFYRQATLGDAPPEEDRPLDQLGKDKWDLWNKYRGTPKDVAKRRYITYMRNIDPKLVHVSLNERPPFGFPRTDRDVAICARCNSVAGCLRDLLDDKNQSLKSQLMSDATSTNLYEYENLKAWFESAQHTQRCKWGMHHPVTEGQARPYKEWYNRPDVMGFKPFKKASRTYII